LVRLPCRVLLSGYASELYTARLQGWRVLEFAVGTRRGQAIESLWCNFPPPVEYHDTRFVGVTFRERERIKRKTGRWVRRLAAMDPHERAAILAAIGGQSSAPPPAVRPRGAHGEVRSRPAVPDPQRDLFSGEVLQ
jgi:hypothetical protein